MGADTIEYKSSNERRERIATAVLTSFLPMKDLGLAARYALAAADALIAALDKETP